MAPSVYIDLDHDLEPGKIADINEDIDLEGSGQEGGGKGRRGSYWKLWGGVLLP